MSRGNEQGLLCPPFALVAIGASSSEELILTFGVLWRTLCANWESAGGETEDVFAVMRVLVAMRRMFVFVFAGMAAAPVL